MKIGLIVNPIAGLGGAVGLKGSDGEEIQARARALGAVPHANQRAIVSLQPLQAEKEHFELLAAPGEMGERAALQAGYTPHVLGVPSKSRTSAEHTLQAAQAMRGADADLILFAGGDGTARDMVQAVGTSLLTLGIPAGVKIHSAAYAVNPHAAGELALAFLRGRVVAREAEVVDLDEQAYRAGVIATRLYGFLRIPYQPSRVQARKAPTPANELVQAQAIAAALKEIIRPGWVYILAPGTTTGVIARELGFQKTLVGVDVIGAERVLLADATEMQILDLLSQRAEERAKIIVTPIGGQGFLFGRGNQQISPAVIQRVGRENIHIVCLPAKLAALGGRPFIVDTGDPAVDQMLAGYYSVITGYHEEAIYRVT